MLKEIGLRMEVPAGWKVGLPSFKSGKRYKIDPKGDHCFPSESHSYPFGRVWSFDLAPFSSLTEFIHTQPTLHGLTLTERPILISGYEGIEVIGFGIGENKIPVKGVYQYIQKGEKVIVASFLTIEDSFPAQESLFRSALKSLKID
ncbi:MAG: hypothetical protein ABIK81_02430 [candidate division WOR-3 bacterium]